MSNLRNIISEGIVNKRKELTYLDKQLQLCAIKKDLINFNKVLTIGNVFNVTINDFEIDKPSSYYVYIIEHQNSQTQFESSIEKFLKIKTDKSNKKKYPFFNANNKSKVLYVGSSFKIKERLRQHFIDCPNGTYALNLKDWLGKGIKIKLTIIGFNNINSSLAGLIEDGISITLKPIFGKRGGNVMQVSKN